MTYQEEIDQLFGTRGMSQEQLKAAISTLIEQEVRKAFNEAVELCMAEVHNLQADDAKRLLARIAALQAKEME